MSSESLANKVPTPFHFRVLPPQGLLFQPKAHKRTNQHQTPQTSFERVISSKQYRLLGNSITHNNDSVMPNLAAGSATHTMETIVTFLCHKSDSLLLALPLALGRRICRGHT